MGSHHVGSSVRARHALTLSVLALFTALDLLAGRDQQVLSLVVITPLVAATMLGRRATVGYAALALVVAALLGIYDQQYTAETILAQTIRLFGVGLGGVVAVAACTLRLQREQELSRLSAQAATSRAAVQVAEVLQRHLLGPPPHVDRLETAVRYLPAARHAEVGGDWYDAFGLPDGTTMLVIGDVAGHDAPAAAVMAQTRGMLRAVAQSVPGSPATVLTTLDRAFTNLGLHTLVTVAVATVDLRPAAGRSDGPVPLRWSNAGHPPPVLICADGTIKLLERTPDRLLGATPDAERADHEIVFGPGDTLLLYTDGLVERRTVPIDDGTAWLVRELGAIGRAPLDRLCDDLVTQMGNDLDDDVAFLAVRLPCPRATASEPQPVSAVASPQR
jgi:serine phosphatase RsbU (regulator of sigma subunit)